MPPMLEKPEALASERRRRWRLDLTHKADEIRTSRHLKGPCSTSFGSPDCEPVPKGEPKSARCPSALMSRSVVPETQL